MGCGGSREKALQERTSLNSKELEKCRGKFKKLSRIAPGYLILYKKNNIFRFSKENQYIEFAGFKSAFWEN